MSKKCGCCSLIREDSDFNVKYRRGGLEVLQSYCRDCQRATSAAHYQNNKDREKSRLAINRKRRQAEVRLLLNELKDFPCADCGNRYKPWQIDFDHVHGTKMANIARMLTASDVQIMDEVAKCEVVCANCHRDRTHRRLDRL